LRRLLLSIIVLGLAWTIAIVLTGGIHLDLGFAILRARAPERPLAVVIAAALVYGFRYTAEFTAALERSRGIVRRVALPLALAFGIALAVHGWRFGTLVAGSADSYGYVNQAYDWARGKLPAPIPLEMTLPIPSERVQIPLGYTVGARPHTMVPVYAPGLPLVMAPFTVLGPCGPYLVVPLCAALFVWFTFLLGRRVAGPTVGLLAAGLVAVSPVVLFQAEWPMSDVPAGACWTAALAFALGRTRRSAALGGVATALGLLIRPNLLFLTLVPFAYATLREPEWRERLYRAALFSVSVASAAILIAVLNTMWYGAPWKSGYGPASSLYAFGNVWTNVRQFGTWLWQSESPFVLFAVLPLLPKVAPGAVRRALLPCAVFAAVALISYIAYIPFDQWWYLRFLLPGFGAFVVLMSAGLAVAVRRLPPSWAVVPAIVVVVAVFLYDYHFAANAGTFGGLGQRRYVDIAQYVDENLPPNAAVLTMQHSGAIRFYAGRYSLRYDAMGPRGNARLLKVLVKQGYHPYLVIDDWERPRVAEVFGLPADAPLPWALAGQLLGTGNVDVFDLAARGPLETTYVRLGPEPPPCLAPREARLPTPVH
jgi:4-amino-4-deoxy-L-arabinose transferase-like glycosyltransferase